MFLQPLTSRNAVFWDVAACRSCVNRRFRGTYLLHFQCRKIRDRRTSVSCRRLQPPAHAGSSLGNFSTMKMEALRSSETLVHRISTRRHIPEDGNPHSHRRENLKSYINVEFKWLVKMVRQIIIVVGEDVPRRYQYVDCVASNCWMIEEFERMWSHRGIISLIS
jgi:hypothetical protein